MIRDPEHIAAMATALVLDHARTVPREKIEALIGEHFPGLGHVDCTILADQITEAIATCNLSVDIATAIQSGDSVMTPDGPGFVFGLGGDGTTAHVTLDGQNRNATYSLGLLERVDD